MTVHQGIDAGFHAVRNAIEATNRWPGSAGWGDSEPLKDEFCYRLAPMVGDRAVRLLVLHTEYPSDAPDNVTPVRATVFLNGLIIHAGVHIKDAEGDAPMVTSWEHAQAFPWTAIQSVAVQKYKSARSNGGNESTDYTVHVEGLGGLAVEAKNQHNRAAGQELLKSLMDHLQQR